MTEPVPPRPRLRPGRRKPQNVYLQRGPEPAEEDEVLFSIRGGAKEVAWICAAVRLANATQDYSGTIAARNEIDDARSAFRAAERNLRYISGGTQ